jgi:hypothetical protein
MNNRYLTNFILIITVLGLFWLNKQPEDNEQALTPLSDIPSDSIEHIIIKRHDSLDITIVKHEQQWLIEQPITAPANQTRIELLLSVLNMPIRGQLEVSAATDLARFGFSESSPTLQLNNQKFIFGNTEAISQLRYVLYNNTLYLTHDQIFQLLTTSVNNYIENHLIPRMANLTKLTIPTLDSEQHISEKVITLAKINGHWQSDYSDISTDELTLFVDNWHYASATQAIINPKIDLAQYTLNAILWFEGKDKPLQFKIKHNSRGFSLYNSEASLLYLLPNSTINELFPSLK